VVLLDLARPDKNGMEVLSEIRLLHPQAAHHHDHGYGHGRKRCSCHAVRRNQLIQKPWTTENCWLTCARRLPAKGGRREHPTEAALSSATTSEPHVGKSEPMLKIFDLVAQVAPALYVIAARRK